jgi:hypothetical protein
MESPTVIPRTAPVLAKSHGPLSATSPIIATGKVVSRLNSVADSPLRAVKPEITVRWKPGWGEDSTRSKKR